MVHLSFELAWYPVLQRLFYSLLKINLRFFIRLEMGSDLGLADLGKRSGGLCLRNNFPPVFFEGLLTSLPCHRDSQCLQILKLLHVLQVDQRPVFFHCQPNSSFLWSIQ